MAAIDWNDVNGQVFSDEEAREASDFEEILANFGMEPDEAFRLFRNEKLTIAKRLVFATKGSSDDVSWLLLADEDDRIRKVASERLRKELEHANGGIIC